jgi:hypothetical protein
MLPPAATGSTLSLFVTDTSATAWVPTAVVSVSLLFSGLLSIEVVVATAVLLIAVPLSVPAGTFTMSVKVAVAPAAREAMLATTGPVPPAVGDALTVKPPAGANDTKVVPAGTRSVRITLLAACGPTLFTVIV